MEHTHKTGRGGTTAAQDKTFNYLITGLEKSTEFNWTNISDFRKLQGAHSCALLKSTLENRGGGHAQHALGLLPFPRNSFDKKLIEEKQKIQIAIMKKTLPGSRGADRDRGGRPPLIAEEDKGQLDASYMRAANAEAHADQAGGSPQAGIQATGDHNQPVPDCLSQFDVTTKNTIINSLSSKCARSDDGDITIDMATAAALCTNYGLTIQAIQSITRWLVAENAANEARLEGKSAYLPSDIKGGAANTPASLKGEMRRIKRQLKISQERQEIEKKIETNKANLDWNTDVENK